LAPLDLTMAEFTYTIRSRMELPPSRAMFMFTSDGVLPCQSDLVISVYEKFRHKDGFLYLLIYSENVFGFKSQASAVAGPAQPARTERD
jgi:GABA(A) receptor-associated protein